MSADRYTSAYPWRNAAVALLLMATMSEIANLITGAFQ